MYDKGYDEEEYALPLKREGGCRFPLGTDAERPPEGKDVEGSFRTGEPRADRRMWKYRQPAEVSSHELSPLQDRTLSVLCQRIGSR